MVPPGNSRYRLLDMDRSGFVLTMASYYGTLAAVRCLGNAEVPVFMADADAYGPAAWSRHVTRRLRCPPPRSVDAFVQWLLDLGEWDPGHVLYATSDDLAWIIAAHEDVLRKHFKLLTPPFSAMAALLDKGRLYEACRAVGMHTPRTWLPTSWRDVERIAHEVDPPVILKPRTQVLFDTQFKGRVLWTREELRASYGEFLRTNRYDARMLARQPEVAWPMLQEFCGKPGDPIYSLSGFSDPRHDVFVARATYKLLQWPRQAGVGILFEDAPLCEDLTARVRRLCETTGFYGVFEAEFVEVGQERRLIDFNPRFFGQIGFDVARQLPSPYLVYLDAMGDVAGLRDAAREAQGWRRDRTIRFGNRAALRLTRAAERVVGQTIDRWANGASHGVPLLDASLDPDDWVPGILDGVQQVALAMIHPRATLRSALRRN